MPNTTLTATTIAKEALLVLDNELVMSKKVHRGYEEEVKSVNGYQTGETITIRRPTDFTVRRGRTADVQEVQEGKTTITVDRQRGIDFKFTSSELTLNIKDLSERVIKPAMVQLANEIDADLMSLYSSVPNWVGTPGQVVNSFADFAKAPELMDDYAVPSDDRCAVLTPQDHWGIAGAATSVYMNNIASEAYRKGSIGMVGGVDTYKAQNVTAHTVGVATGTPLVNGANQNVLYSAVKDTWQQTLATDGWTNSTTGILKAGDVFTIAGVFGVNPVTKASTGRLRQFVVLADANSGASTGPATLTISPPIITSGAFQTVTAVPADNAAITVLGTGGTSYRQNLVFHKNAFALVSVPLVKPAGAIDVGRESYKGMSVRVVPVYDGISDESMWRLDVLYGIKTIDGRLAARLSGTS